MRRRSAVGAVGLALAVFAALAVMAALALGADPTATPSAVPTASPLDLVNSGDPRSEGSGPGLVGSPLLILAGVVGLGLATAALTVLAAGLTRRD